jgi:flagellar biogenesis protein FliO
MIADPAVQPLIVVMVCVGLAGAFFWLRKKFVQAASALQRRGSRLRVIERVHLTPQHSIHLVSVGNKTLLVAASPGSCQILESSAGGFQQ